MSPGETVDLVSDLIEGDGPAVVLLHGLTQQRRFWRPVITRIESSPHAPRVIALDLRGHGDSPRPDGPYDVNTCADDVAAHLDRLRERGAVVVGHSWGGWVALSLASRRPDLVGSLVCLDGGFIRLLDLGDRATVRERLTPSRLGMPLDELRSDLEQGPLGPWWTDETWEALRPTFDVDADGRVTTRLGFDRHMRVLDGALDFDPRPHLQQVMCPTWLVHCSPVEAAGEADAWRKAGHDSLESAQEQLAGPRVLRWAGALHDVPLQWPWLVAGLIRACVDEIRPSDRGGKGTP